MYCLPQPFILFLIIWQTNCILVFSKLIPAWLDLHISVLSLDKFCGFVYFKFVFIWSYSQGMVLLPPATNVPYHLDQYCFFFMCYWLWSFNILAVIQILHCALVPRGGGQWSCGVQTASSFSESDSPRMRLVTDPYSCVCACVYLWRRISEYQTGKLEYTIWWSVFFPQNTAAVVFLLC